VTSCDATNPCVPSNENASAVKLLPAPHVAFVLRASGGPIGSIGEVARDAIRCTLLTEVLNCLLGADGSTGGRG